jgi:hypothetical protein
MTLRFLSMLSVCLVLLCADVTLGQGRATLARQAAEFILQRFGKEAVAQGVESLTRQIHSLALRYGDDVFLAVRKVGPRSLKIIGEAGEHGAHAVRLMARHGDQAVWVIAKPNRMALFVRLGDEAAESMIKHGEIVEVLLATSGKNAALALKAIDTRNGRRLVMLIEDGLLTKTAQPEKFFDLVAKYGNRAVEFVWQNRKLLQTAAILSSFLANPLPYLEGSADLQRANSSPASNSNGSGTSP